MPHPTFLAALAAALALLAGTASAATDDARKLYTQSLAATCANCHGTQGKAVKDAALPGLAGMQADYLMAQMKAFRKGERQATIMHQIAKGYTDEQVRLLAEYFAAQTP